MRIELLDPVTATESELRAWYDCRLAAARTDFPADPDLPYPLVVGQLHPDGTERRHTWVARTDAGNLLGGVRLALPDDENRHACDAVPTVRPQSRRRGVGRALLEHAVSAARADGRRSMSGGAPIDSAGARFGAAMGAVEKMRETRSLLRLADVSWADLTAFAAASAAPDTVGYRLRRWRDRCPDELGAAYARALSAMNDAPVGDLDHHPVSYTVERLRQFEGSRSVRGQQLYVVCAQVAATGEIAGLTELFVPHSGPRAEQGATAVQPEHRGHGLGLWMKTTMLRWLLSERSQVQEVTEIETWNASENTFMRRVNARLGYVALDEWANLERSLS